MSMDRNMFASFVSYDTLAILFYDHALMLGDEWTYVSIIQKDIVFYGRFSLGRCPVASQAWLLFF